MWRRLGTLSVAAALVVGAAATASAQEAAAPPAGEAAARVVRTIGSPGSGTGQLFLPEQVDLLADGTVLVGQGLSLVNGTPRFQLFERDGTPLGTPTLPTATRWDVDTNGDFVSLDPAAAGIEAHVEWPVAFEVGPDGLLYVSDSVGRRIVVLTLDGALVRTIGGTGGASFERPGSIAFGPGGEVVVFDDTKSKIFVFSSTGALLRKWGSFGYAAGQFSGGGTVAVAPNGDVFVTGSGGTPVASRVQRFRSDGRYLEEYRGLSATADIAVDEQGRVYAVDPLAHNVKVIKPGDGVLVDARIRRGTGPLIGDGLYSTADLAGGNNQYPSLAIVRAGTTVTFTVSMQNDRAAADRLKITGLGSISNVDVRYYRNGADVTSRVVAGTYVTGPIASGGTHDLTVKITPRGATFGTFIRKITVSSMTRPSAKDTVLAMVSSS